MLITKYTSIRETILSLYRDTGMDSSVNMDDIAYWVYQVFESVKYPLLYLPKIIGHKESEAWEFDNYKVKLPDDFHMLRALSVDGVTAIPSSNVYHDILDGSCCGWDQFTYPGSPEVFYDNFGNMFSPQAPPITVPVAQFGGPLTFTINNSYITFNVESGKACMAYWAFPVDSEGFPMIPDIAEFKEAVVAYVTERLDYKAWRKGAIEDKIYKKSEKERNWSIAKLDSALKTPDEHQMEGIKNMMTKMLVRKDDYIYGFRNTFKQGLRGRY